MVRPIIQCDEKDITLKKHHSHSPRDSRNIRYTPDLADQVTVCQPDLPLILFTRPHTHTHAPVGHLPVDPPSTAQMDLFQPVLR